MNTTLEGVVIDFEDKPIVPPVDLVGESLAINLRYVILVKPTPEDLQRSGIPDRSMMAARISVTSENNTKYDLEYIGDELVDCLNLRASRKPRINVSSKTPNNRDEFKYVIESLEKAFNTYAWEANPSEYKGTISQNLVLPRKINQDMLASHHNSLQRMFPKTEIEYTAYWNVETMALTLFTSDIEGLPKFTARVYISSDNQEDMELLTRASSEAITARLSVAPLLKEYSNIISVRIEERVDEKYKRLQAFIEKLKDFPRKWDMEKGLREERKN